MELYTWVDRFNNYVEANEDGTLFVGTAEQLILFLGLKEPEYTMDGVSYAGAYGMRHKYYHGFYKAHSPAIIACPQCQGRRAMHSETCSMPATMAKLNQGRASHYTLKN